MWIYGAGGFGRETHGAAMEAGMHVDGFLDDASAGASVRSLPIRLAEQVEPGSFVVAIADPGTRDRLQKSMVADGWQASTIVDPRAILGNGSSIGEGSVVLATAYVSCDVVLGCGTQLNYGVTVGHDVHGGDAITVLPGANIGGSVQLGAGVLVGSGAQILQGRCVGPGAVVGAGAVVTSDVDAGETVVGIPARPVR